MSSLSQHSDVFGAPTNPTQNSSAASSSTPSTAYLENLQVINDALKKDTINLLQCQHFRCNCEYKSASNRSYHENHGDHNCNQLYKM